MKVISTLAPAVIQWPTPAQMESVAADFMFRRGFPKVIGAVDGSHIRIKWPTGTPKAYINRKGYASIVLQGVCDNSGRFTNVYCRFPGSAHDSRVLHNSQLELQHNVMVPSGYVILGDSGYPLHTWLLTPYKGQPHTLGRNERKFNFIHSSTRIVIEHAFGRMKGRWKRMQCLDVELEMAPYWVGAACALHNWCDNLDPWPDMYVADEQPYQEFNMEAPHADAKRLRDELCAWVNVNL